MGGDRTAGKILSRRLQYQSTKFEKLAPGKQEVREGPFEDYEVAKKVWQRLAWETVDNALAHFHIEQVRLQLPGEVSETQYWVIGGSFGAVIVITAMAVLVLLMR